MKYYYQASSVNEYLVIEKNGRYYDWLIDYYNSWRPTNATVLKLNTGDWTLKEISLLEVKVKCEEAYNAIEALT